ncbi:MAG TPA: L-histidine N(alpha)-methyltransferase [Terriglobales bacterium]|nr:L-histidine N(alpha)-methyltransferase [Terriglobales bacterium]
MAATANPLPISVLLTEHEIAAQFADALARGYLGEQFFYWLPLSVEAWVALCRSPEYRNADRALTLLSRAAPRLAGLWPGVDTLCGVGCGEGSKDRVLLDAFPRLLYIGSDFSQGVLELALARAAPAARAVHGFKLDIGSDQHLAALAAAVRDSGSSAVYTVLGNTLGAFDPDRFPSRLRRLMRPGDRVLFDGEIFAGAETLRGYDHPTNRRFAFAPLAALGLTESDGELRFELRPGTAGLHEVVKYFVPAGDLDLKVAGHELRLRKDEPLRMSSSLKYDEPAFFERIEHGGFRVEFSDKSDDGRFLLAAAAPADP